MATIAVVWLRRSGQAVESVAKLGSRHSSDSPFVRPAATGTSGRFRGVPNNHGEASQEHGSTLFPHAWELSLSSHALLFDLLYRESEPQRWTKGPSGRVCSHR